MKKILLDLILIFIACLIVSFSDAELKLENIRWGLFFIVCALYFAYRGVKYLIEKVKITPPPKKYNDFNLQLTFL